MGIHEEQPDVTPESIQCDAEEEDSVRAFIQRARAVRQRMEAAMLKDEHSRGLGAPESGDTSK